MKPRNLSHNERVDWLRLARTSGVGPVTFNKLIARYGQAKAALDELPKLARRGGRKSALKPNARAQAEAELDQLDQLGARLICACEPEFPQNLNVLETPPPVISTLGPLNPDSQPCCAMVGARNSSAIGVKFAGQLAHELGQRGMTVVSGLARGIDGAAHAASLETGTIAVIAGGLDRIYPPEHADLQHAIAREGLIVSEAPPGYTAQARDFPKRNRLISGLSRGVIIIEAAERSGSLITARFAGEQGREVMAVPGSPLDPRAKGTNRLLRDGAALIESADDVIDVLNAAHPPTLFEPSPLDFECKPMDHDKLDKDIDAVRERIAERLSPVAVSKDELVRQTGAPAHIVLSCLVELELAGRCVLAANGQVFSEDF